MNLNKLYLCLAFLFILQGSFFSQQSRFTAIAVKGDISLRNSSNENFKALYTGAKISQGEIKLVGNAYLAVVHSSGKSLELRNDGIYKVDDIEKTIFNNNQSATSKLGNYLADKMTSTANSKEMKLLGAVVRANRPGIELASPIESNVIDSTMTFAWFRSKLSKNYIFRLLNSRNRTVYMQELEDTTFTINRNEMNLEKSTSYKWFIHLAADEKVCSDTGRFLIINDLQKRLLMDTLTSVFGNKQGSESAINSLLTARFFEDRNFRYEAEKYYSLGMSIAPEVREYTINYVNFLVNCGMERKAILIWNHFNKELK